MPKPERGIRRSPDGWRIWYFDRTVKKWFVATEFESFETEAEAIVFYRDNAL
jgi:hypothetical protein